MIRIILVLAALAWISSPSPGWGQIVNTLRGFADDEPGWSGGLDGYFDLAEGNTEFREYGASATVQFLKNQHRVRALGSALRKESRGEEIAESSRIHLRHNYWFHPRWATIAFVQDSRNPFQRLESRFLFGLGARFDAVRGDRFQVYLGLVSMLENEEIQGDERGRENEHRMSSYVSMLYDPSERTELDLVAFYQPEWRDFGDYRTVVSARLKVEVIGSLYLSLNYEFQKASRPPDGVGETDWTLRSGVGVAF